MVWSKLKLTVCTILCCNVLLCANELVHVQCLSSLYGSCWKHVICANTHSYLRSQGFLHITVWFFSSFPQQVATSLAVPHSTMVAFLNSSVFHGTSVPCKYHMITWWYKMPGKISRLPVGFHFWRGEARVFSAGCCSDGVVRVFTLLSRLPK